MKRKALAFAVMVALLASVFSLSPLGAVIDGNDIYLKPGDDVTSPNSITLLVWAMDHFGNGFFYQAESTPNVSGTLPEGLRVELHQASPNSVLLMGNTFFLRGNVPASPTVTEGSFKLTLTEDGGSPPDVQELEFNWTIHNCEIAVYPSTLPNATVGVAYSVQLLPYKADLSGPWCGSAGPNEVITYQAITDLPPGLSFNTATGVISGTPTTAGSYTFDAGIIGETRNSDNQIELHQAGGDAPLTISVAARSSNQRQDDDGDDGEQQMIYYMIESEAGKGGSIDPNGLTRVYPYENQAYVIRAEAGYVIDRVLVDGKNIGAVGKYEFTRVTADHLIQAYFAREAAAPQAPEAVNHNPSTGAPGPGRGAISLGAAFLLLGAAWLLKGKK